MERTVRIFLQTDRLILRRFTESDTDDLFDLDDDPEVMRFLTGGEPTARSVIEDEILPHLLRYYERFPGFGCWAAIEKSTGDFLGWFLFRPAEQENVDEVDDVDDVELGYRLKKSAWGEGYATEGSLALIRKSFTELGVRRVFAQTMAVNLASRRVMEKVGLRYVRTFHEDWPDPIEGVEHGEVEYALRKEEWEKRRES